MELLQSAMAFAVVMIILSTIVAGIVELLLRVLAARAGTLENAIKALFDDVIWPRTKQAVTALAENQVKDGETEAQRDERLKKAFIGAMTDNPAYSPGAPVEGAMWILDRITAGSAKEKIDILSTLAFVERLGKTEIGKAIAQEGQERLDLIIRDFAASYERYSAASIEALRKRGSQFAMVVAVIFALAANVDAIRLFSFLVDNPGVRTSLIEQAEEAAEQNQAAIADMKAVLEKLESGEIPESDLPEELKGQVSELKASFSSLTEAGLPIGRTYYPWTDLGRPGPEGLHGSLAFVLWVFNAMLAGVLIGLGGPFWYKAFTGLSQLLQVLRVFRGNPELVEEKPEAAERPDRSHYVEAFKVSAEVLPETAVLVESSDAREPAG